jgi:hypothetical protein
VRPIDRPAHRIGPAAASTRLSSRDAAHGGRDQGDSDIDCGVKAVSGTKLHFGAALPGTGSTSSGTRITAQTRPAQMAPIPLKLLKAGSFKFLHCFLSELEGRPRAVQSRHTHPLAHAGAIGHETASEEREGRVDVTVAMPQWNCDQRRVR